MSLRYIDFDGTLATFDGWEGPDHLGEPIPLMVRRVKNFLAQGDEVVIFTARMTYSDKYNTTDQKKTKALIQEWCLKHIGKKLGVTNIKMSAESLYDDRAFRVVRNTGLTTEEFLDIIIRDELESDRTKEQSLQRILQTLEVIKTEHKD